MHIDLSDPIEEVSQKIFLRHAGSDDKSILGWSTEDQRAALTILEICAGLPWALAAAGSAVRDLRLYLDIKCVGAASQVFTGRLAASPEILTQKAVGNHEGLRGAVQSRLALCEQRMQKTSSLKETLHGKTLHSLYRSLAVREKRHLYRSSLLKRL